jgi:hypothetical protein
LEIIYNKNARNINTAKAEEFYQTDFFDLQIPQEYVSGNSGKCNKNGQPENVFENITELIDIEKTGYGTTAEIQNGGKKQSKNNIGKEYGIDVVLIDFLLFNQAGS